MLTLVNLMLLNYGEDIGWCVADTQSSNQNVTNKEFVRYWGLLARFEKLKKTNFRFKC